MKKLSYLLVILVTALYACDSDPDNEPSSESYVPLSIGNYWIYKTYLTDPSYNPNNITFIQEDSIYVDRIEVVQGESFYVLKGFPTYMFGEYNQNGEVFLRDSSGTIVSFNQKIIFTKNSFTDNGYYLRKYTINQGDTISCYIELIEQGEDSTITSPENIVYHISNDRHKLCCI